MAKYPKWVIYRIVWDENPVTGRLELFERKFYSDKNEAARVAREADSGLFKSLIVLEWTGANGAFEPEPDVVKVIERALGHSREGYEYTGKPRR